MTADAPAPVRPGTLSRGPAFAAVTAMFVLFMAASGAPSPLYVVYQHRWGFSATTLTIVFAAYVGGLLASLLVVGALSDHVGRRPVLAGAVALEAVSLVMFLTAGNVVALTAARIAQGIATGAAVTTLGAALVDLDPPHARGRAGMVNSVAPVGGLAIGALACGTLVQYAPGPTHLVYAILLGGMVFAALAVAFLPETSSRRPGAFASLRPRVGVPARMRGEVLGLVPILAASWALGGLYLSLGPSVAASLFGHTSHVVGGLVVTLLCGVGGLTSFLLRAKPVAWLLRLSGLLLAVGMGITLAGVETTSFALAAVGTVIAGAGFGSAALGCFGTLARLAAPHERGELFAVGYVISYVAFSVPAVVAGLAATHAGLHTTVVVYAIVVIALCVAALGIQQWLGSRRNRLEISTSVVS